MKPLSLLRNAALACALVIACPILRAAGPADDPLANAGALVMTAPGITVTTYARGLDNPRGAEVGRYWRIFDPDVPARFLHIAEGGTGGTASTAGLCAQIGPPIGPYTGARTGGRVSMWLPYGAGTRFSVATGLPTSQTSAGSGSLVSGAADVAFINDQLYILVSGGGCSHGVRDRPNAVVRSNGPSLTLVANLSRWLRANPGGMLGPDVEPDGTWYSMVARNNLLYLIEPNHGLFVRVNPATGAITRLLDVSAALGYHAVPTALAYHKGDFYIANLGTFPIVDGSQRVWRVLTNPLRLQQVARGTAIVGLAFDPVDDAMYILQLTSGAPDPSPGMGSIVRIRPGGSPQTIVRGLTFPTAMTFYRDSLYVSHIGFGPPLPGSGEVLRVRLR